MSDGPGGKDRRRKARSTLRLPVRIQGHRPDGQQWTADSTTEDGSIGGTAFVIPQEVRIGQALLLTIPMPRSLREHDHWASAYKTYALVRHVERLQDRFRVGVMFYGKRPPRGYDVNPGARFLLPGDARSLTPAPVSAREAAESPPPPPEEPPEPDPPPAPFPARRPEPEEPVDADPGGQRGTRRFEIFVNLTLQEVDEFGVVLREEITVAENLSLGGARVMTSLRFAPGDVVQVSEVGGTFNTRAEVRHAYVGSDRIRRLNLKFLDGQPQHLLPRT